jgi:hypothetical protein
MLLSLTMVACSPRGQVAPEKGTDAAASPKTTEASGVSSASSEAQPPAKSPVASASVSAHDEDVHLLELVNPGFENGMAGWTIESASPEATVTQGAARQGGGGLQLEDTSKNSPTAVVSASFPVEPGRAYRMTFFGRRLSGNGLSVYLRFLDAKGKYLNPWPDYTDQIGVESPDWKAYSVTAIPPVGSVAVDVKVGSYNWSTALAQFDDFTLESFVPACEPPWEPQYYFDLQAPADVARLTPADVPGPDGLVYPDWRRAGVAGGIPAADDLLVMVGAEEFAGYEGQDIADHLQAALDQTAEDGGGVVELPAGHFLLSHPVLIRGSNVVLRGAGRDKTHLLFVDHIPYGTLRSWSWAPTNQIGPNGFFEIQANPKNLIEFKVTSEGKTVVDEKLRKHWGGRFYARMRGEDLLAKLGPGRHTLEGVATYKNGDSFRGTFEVAVFARQQPGDTWADQHAALSIAGAGYVGGTVLLPETARRGERFIPLKPGHGLKPGDWFIIEAPLSPRWNKLTGNRKHGGVFRINQYRVKSVSDGGVTIPDALRLDFPVEDHSYVRKVELVENSGIEGLTVEQKVITTKLEGEKIPETGWYAMEDLWTDGVTVSCAANSWVSDVRVLNAGRNPLYVTRSKQCEVRGIEVRGALYKGGGGTGYVGIERSFDCLMDGAMTEGMRHAPDLQWGAAGNVIRNGHFIGSDGQWHAGWTNENLFENNVITLTEEDMANGAYGNGLFASGPLSTYHGPQGPRNVVYHNDVTAPLDGLHMVGGNEAWLILYNRFRLGEGYAVYGREKTFDHVIKDNVFIMKKPETPAILFGAPNCTGIQIIDNHFYGPVKEVAGFTGKIGNFELVAGNTVEPYPASEADMPARPTPPVPSIFEWQREHLPALVE